MESLGWFNPFSKQIIHYFNILIIITDKSSMSYYLKVLFGISGYWNLLVCTYFKVTFYFEINYTKV